MSKCSCNKTACTYPDTAEALANLANEIAKLQDRVKVLEKTIADWTAEK